MTSIYAAKRKEKAVSAHPLPVRLRLAQFHESRHKFTSAAELWAGLHDETGDSICIHKMWCLARKAQRAKKHDVAEAIYLILHSKTKDSKYILFALAAGERAHMMQRSPHQ